MKYIIFLFLFVLVCFHSCSSQTLENVNKNSKMFTRKAMSLMDTTFFLNSYNDTLRYLQAISYLDSAICYDSTNYYAYWQESQFLSELKRYKEALYVISSYSRSHKNNLSFLLREAFLCDVVGDSISAKNKYEFILKATESYLTKEPTNKRLMIVKYTILLMLKDKGSEGYLEKIRNKFPQDEEINNLVVRSKDFNKNKFINDQLTGGESENVKIP